MLQRACLRSPVKIEASSKYSPVGTLKQQNCFVPAKHKVVYSGVSDNMVLPASSTERLGTTVIAMKYKDGVIIGADSRTLNPGPFSVKRDDVVKVGYLQQGVYIGGAGTLGKFQTFCDEMDTELFPDSDCVASLAPLDAAEAAFKIVQDEDASEDYKTKLKVLIVEVFESECYIHEIDGATVKLRDRSLCCIGSGSSVAMDYLFSAENIEKTDEPENLDETTARRLVLEALKSAALDDWATGGTLNLYIIRKGDRKLKRMSAIPHIEQDSDEEFPRIVYDEFDTAAAPYGYPEDDDP